tara:strand:- start:81 stop:398 length:318 start_codon:yes stop_codon:yes gene_type:complete
MFIERMNKGSWGKVKAFFDVQTQEGFTIKGYKLVEGINGMFVGFPSEKSTKDGEYRDTVWAERELKDKVTDLANKVYSSDAGVKSQDNFIEKAKTQQNTDEDIPF